MIAAVVRKFNEELSLEQVPEPQCPDNGVVLEVLACGVCRSDYHGWTGNHPLVTHGSILGHEYCGTVVEAGAKARHKIGDRLIAPFILGCGTCPACQTGKSNTCGSQIVPGFSAPVPMPDMLLFHLIIILFICHLICHRHLPPVWGVE